jgi:hypothetical protein
MGNIKEIRYDLIALEEELAGESPYKILETVREAHHPDTIEAKIALAWKRGIKVDSDGHLVLGQCVKANELQRELVDYDFVIVLNREVWEDAQFTREQKVALIDHEMCHVAPAVDEDGEPRIDSKNRPVWRLRGHDIEEFTAIIARHGLYKRDLEIFGQQIVQRQSFDAIGRELQPETVEIRGEKIVIPAKASMGTEFIDPFPDGRVM